jgi:flagellar basal body-associated protein FliL
MATEETPPTTEVKKTSKWVSILLIVALCILLVTQGITAYLLVSAKPTSEAEVLPADAASIDPSPHPKEVEDEELEEGERPLGAIFPFDTMVSNLQGGGYIRIQLQLEFVDRDIPRKFLSRQVLVRDSILALIATKEKGQMSSTQGKEELRDQIKEIVGATLKKEVVERVFFTQFLVY